MQQTDEMLTTAEVAAELGVDRSTLTRWVKRGVLVPARRLPTSRGALLFSREDVEAIAAERAR